MINNLKTNKMLVKIDPLDDGSGVDTRLRIYKVYNTRQKLTEGWPYCLIEQDDFFDLFRNPEKEFEKACEGKEYFNVTLNELDVKCKKIY